MQITINVSEEQEKALLTEYRTIEEYAQRILENRANQIMTAIVNDYARGKCKVTRITASEQSVIDTNLANKIIVQSDRVPDAVKAIIVKRANTKSMATKIAEREAKFTTR